MEFFRSPNYNWIGKKWHLIGLSVVLSMLGMVSLISKGGPSYGIDFKGGTLVHLQFQELPSLERIRAALQSQGLGNSTLQRYGAETDNEILIGLDLEAASEEDLDAGRRTIIAALNQEFGEEVGFEVRSVELVGPRVGAALRRQALNATLLALASMLIYIAYRFEWIYGIAAVVAVFHDVIITVGFLSLTGREITLTIIAALLTLVGFSVNDTIVVFDRVRENVKLMRREKISEVVNRSINQTLSRTVLTSGLTFLTVLALFLFGGEVLRGFSFTLVVGVLIGTYSSIAIGSMLVVSWQEYRNRVHRPGKVLTLERDRGKAKRTKVSAGTKI
jgi:preprotein translocase subunit SecF